MGLNNHGEIHLHNNIVDGLNVSGGGKVENFASGKIHSHDNGRHGIFVAEDVATLKANIAQADVLLNTEDLRSLREELEPLFAKVKQDLDSPEINTAGIQSTLSKVLTHLSGVGQGIMGNIIYNQLPDFNHLKHLIDASIQLLSQGLIPH